MTSRLMVLAFVRWAVESGSCVSLLFLDIIAAFYALLRRLVVGLDTSDEAVAKLIAKLNLPPAVFQDLLQHLSEPPLLEQLGVHDHVHELFDLRVVTQRFHHLYEENGSIL